MTLKWLILAVMTTMLVLASCNTDENPAQQYGNTMVQSVKSAKKVDATVNVEQVTKSIQEFNAANGRYPADLNELSTFNGIALKSNQYDYDPVTGNLAEKR